METETSTVLRGYWSGKVTNAWSKNNLLFEYQDTDHNISNLNIAEKGPDTDKVHTGV